jgi:ABC-type Fe3+-siderophore transport system permease subunit
MMTGAKMVAASLGFSVARTRLIVTLAVVFLTAAIVSFVGVIGFVGLVAPHIARLLVQGDNKVLLPFSMITDAASLPIRSALSTNRAPEGGLQRRGSASSSASAMKAGCAVITQGSI